MPATITPLLRLLGDDTRLRLLHLLAQEPLTVAELQELLGIGQSSASGHLDKLREAGFIHRIAEGSAHRYRLRDDLSDDTAAAWHAIRDLSADEAVVCDDRTRLRDLRSARAGNWVERVAGTLHREYAPGRTIDTLFHGLSCCLDLGRCIDIGAGDGALLEILAPRCRELLCVDPSPAMVAAGQTRAGDLGLDHVRYLRAGGEDLPVPSDTFDTALFIQSLQYIDDPQRAVREALRTLRPGGRIVLMTLARHRFSEADRYGHRHHGFSQDQLATWLADCSTCEIHELPAETRAPCFAAVIATGIKR
ncbi:MAG: ArsR/SmtB family transcription factor [Planctomycetota bacterium]|jgi:ArsR family transcriptional regulator